MRMFIFLGLLALTFPAFAQTVDLTYPFNEQTIYWPTVEGFKLHVAFAGITPKGYYYSANTITLPEHGGTHLDAPIHFAKGRLTVDRIPVEQLRGDAAVIDVRVARGGQKDYQITRGDIQNWEAQNGPLTSKDIVFFNTGWSEFWGKKKEYLGTDKMGDIGNLHFPGISEDAAKYLVSKKIKGVGLDTPSLDYGPSDDFKAHRVLLGANIYGIENAANLNTLPPRGYKVVVAPMKIEGGTGAPVRIFAYNN